MTRALVHLPVWLLGLLLIVVAPLVVVAVQAAIRSRWPHLIRGEHNDVLGFLIAVVGVLYAVTLAFIVIVTWENFSDARTTVHREAGALRSLYRDTRALPEPTRARMGELVPRYASAIATEEWKAMDDGESSAQVHDLLGQMFDAMPTVDSATPAQASFLDQSLDRLDDLVELRADRLAASEEGLPGVLWAAIVVGGALTLVFALLFGVSNMRLHLFMVGAFASIIALQIFVVLVLNFPFSGDVRVTPDPIENAVRDFG